MKSIFNLVLFLIVIIILVVICNSFENNKTQPTLQKKIMSEFTGEKITINNIPHSEPVIVFDYEKYIYEKVPRKRKYLFPIDFIKI